MSSFWDKVVAIASKDSVDGEIKSLGRSLSCESLLETGPEKVLHLCLLIFTFKGLLDRVLGNVLRNYKPDYGSNRELRQAPDTPLDFWEKKEIYLALNNN